MAIPSEKVLDLIKNFLTRQDQLLEYIAKAERSREVRDEKMLKALQAMAGITPLPAAAIDIVPILEKYGVLKMANDWLVETVDLSTARDKTEITNLEGALALTIFRNTGSFDLYLQRAGDSTKITVDALTYPQTFLIDNFDIEKVWITNTAQSASATIIKFFRT